MVNTGPMMAQRLMQGAFTGTEGQPGGLMGHFAPGAPTGGLSTMPAPVQPPMGGGSLGWMNGMFGAPVQVYHPPAPVDPTPAPVGPPGDSSYGGGA